MRQAKPFAAALAAALLMTGCGRIGAVQPAVPSANSGSKAASTNVRPADMQSGSLTVSGMGSLMGRVVKLSEQGATAPVAGVTVQIKETGQKFVTDATGTFRASNVAAGNYTFSAMTTGLTQMADSSVLVEANQTAAVPDITMIPGTGPSGITSITYGPEGSFGQGNSDSIANLTAPIGLAVRQGDVLVLDVNNSIGVRTGIVRQYAANGGKFGGKFGDYTKWLGLTQMKNTVRALSLDSQGRALVLDGARQIWRFKPDGSKDKLLTVDVENGNDIGTDGLGNVIVAHAGGLTKLNAEGEGAQTLGALSDVQAVAGVKDGLWVISGNKVLKLAADGNMLFELGASGSGATTSTAFVTASDLAVDPKTGNVIVADKGAKNVYVYDAAGTLIGKVGQGTFESPTEVACDEAGKVFVLDAAKKKVYKFAPLATR